MNRLCIGLLAAAVNLSAAVAAQAQTPPFPLALPAANGVHLFPLYTTTSIFVVGPPPVYVLRYTLLNAKKQVVGSGLLYSAGQQILLPASLPQGYYSLQTRGANNLPGTSSFFKF